MGSLRKTSPAAGMASAAPAGDRPGAEMQIAETPIAVTQVTGPPCAATGACNAAWDGVRAEDWNRFCAGVPALAYQQDFAYGEVLKTMGVDLRRAQLFSGGRWIGAAQVQMRKFFGVFTVALVLRGPVWADGGAINDAMKAAAIEAMRASLPAAGLCGMIVAPDVQQDAGPGDDGLAAAGYTRIMTGWHTVMLDLTRDEAALRAALNGKWRNRLVAAEKAGMTITPFGKRPQQYEWLIAKDEAQQKTAGYRAMPSIMVRRYRDIAGKGAVLGYAARQGAEKIGGMLFLRHADHATYHIGWTSEAGKAANAHNLLLWTAMRGLKKAGVRSLDLGGVDTDANPGIARFKIGTGGRVVSLSGSWTKGPKWRPGGRA